MNKKSYPEMKIRCPLGLGIVTREKCYKCNYSNLGDCGVGAHFVWRPWKVDLYKDYLVSPT